MKVYTGTDIVQVSRIKNAIMTSKESFLDKVYTKKEQDYCNSKRAHMYESYAARFAVKEAVSKALGTGIGSDVGLLDVEVVNGERGKPNLILRGKAMELYNSLNIFSSDISISHTSENAIAFVVMIGE
ncbi:MAG TPA: holo-ACP synthase [Clostridia bacterium]|jgi:holo-[acyl-carrier protein] synthase|nr:holo-ACP synthase [Clostridiaceae bacterium]HOA31660.1 holo-ACP synthase [Clostridia bacterium]HPZ53337.1 holo-ACP synthase [Clostridia bacterium]